MIQGDEIQDEGVAAKAAGLSPMVEPASGLNGSATSIPNAWRSVESAPKDRRILVSCTASAPYPVMIAMWNGETEKWESNDKGTDGKSWAIRAWQPLPDPAPASDVFCSFCGKRSDAVFKLIAGPGVFICNECVGLCDEIIAEEVAQGTEAASAAETGEDTGSVHDGPVA